jgi:hypothetical protein
MLGATGGADGKLGGEGGGGSVGGSAFSKGQGSPEYTGWLLYWHPLLKHDWSHSSRPIDAHLATVCP